MSQTGKLLVIDDDEGICDFICFVADNLGFEATFITDPLHIEMEKFDIMTFDVIFLDFAMPGMNGIEMLSFLAEQNCRAQLVLISGMNIGLLKSSQTMAERHGLNVLGVLTKPIGLETLEKLLTSIRKDK